MRFIYEEDENNEKAYQFNFKYNYASWRRQCYKCTSHGRGAGDNNGRQNSTVDFNHSNTGADLSIHGYTDYAREAYVGFSLPANFSAADLASAKIKLYTKTAGKVGNVNIYPTDYSGFTSGQELEGDDNRLANTGSSIKTFQSPSAKSDVEVELRTIWQIWQTVQKT